jgi:leucyl/phenylalanyl-tRNA--protein transferase
VPSSGPIEPPPSPWDFPPASRWPADDLIALGAELHLGTVLAAYRLGLFPMEVEEKLGWWSPLERGVLPLDGLRVSRSLRRSVGRFEIRVDTAFEDVIDGCADPRREHGWITPAFRSAYVELHRLGWAHSVEAWRDGRLAGGLYGVAIGGLFAGESMFHRETDASKVALVGLVDLMRDEHAEQRLIDVQWVTPHLASLGVAGVPRAAYLRRASAALDLPLPAPFADGHRREPTSAGYRANMNDERTEAIQVVVDRVTSWQDGAPEGTVENELRKGFTEAGVDVSDDDVRKLAEAIEDRHGAVSAEDVL